MLISDSIAQLIEKLLKEGDGETEIKRNDLASTLGCVPSQINYVITSRFTPEKGYIIESRRGGGGYIRIIRKRMDRDEYLMHFICAIGDEIDERTSEAFLQSLYDKDLITGKEETLIRTATSKLSLRKAGDENENALRADILRRIILQLMQ